MAAASPAQARCRSCSALPAAQGPRPVRWSVICRQPAARCARAKAVPPAWARSSTRLPGPPRIRPGEARTRGYLGPGLCSQGLPWRAAGAAFTSAGVCRGPAGMPGSFRLVLLNDASLSSGEPWLAGPGWRGGPERRVRRRRAVERICAHK